jgi:hypothetical protein
MLIFTNRQVDATASDASAFSAAFTPLATKLSFADVARASGGWALSGTVADTADDAALSALVERFHGNRPVLVYLHGNNNTPPDCFERCARLEAIYGVEVVGFSWPSEGLLSSGEDLPGLTHTAGDLAEGEANLRGIDERSPNEGAIARKKRRYRQAKVNGQESAEALARLLRLLATARLYANGQKMTLAAHSLGAHLLQYTLELDGASESLGATTNIALLAACVRAAGHREWVGRLRPTNQLFITYNGGDSVLYAARIVDGNQIKLGADPGSDRLASPQLRYIDFTGAAAGNLGGHGYFVAASADKLPKRTRKLFGRIFGSERDIRDGEAARRVYPAGCDVDGQTCYMAQPDDPDQIG